MKKPPVKVTVSKEIILNILRRTQEEVQKLIGIC